MYLSIPPISETSHARSSSLNMRPPRHETLLPLRDFFGGLKKLGQRMYSGIPVKAETFAAYLYETYPSCLHLLTA